MTAHIIPFHDVQGELRDDILKVVLAWTAAERQEATNGEAAVLIAKALIQAGWRKK